MEHFVPFSHPFPFNPKDARFIGSPIDLIVFDGISDKRDEIYIYIVEVKTGKSKLTSLQKQIKSSVINGKIRWLELNPVQPVLPLNNLNNTENNPNS